MLYSHKKITIILSFLVLILRGGYAQDATKMSLEEAINYAIANSSSIKTSKTNQTDAELQIKQSKATGLPQVSAEVNLQHFVVQPSLPASALGFDGTAGTNFLITQINDNIAKKVPGATEIPLVPSTNARIGFQLKNNFNGGITVSQLLFSGSYIVALKASQSYKDLVNVQSQKAAQNLRYSVTDAYLPALLIDETIKTLDKNIQNLDKTLGEVKAVYKAGFTEQLDVDRLELSINNLKSQRDNLIRQREIPLNVLKLAINYPLDKPLELNDDINSLLKSMGDLDINEAIDYQKRTEIRELDATMKMQELNVELQKAANLPTVAAFGSYQYAFQGNTISKLYGIPTSVIGIKASYSIWDNNERKIKTQRAMLDVEKLRLVKSDAERGITLQVMNARTAIINAQKNIENQQKNLALAERIHAITQKKYKEGVGSSLELTTAERDIYAAQQNLRQAQYDLLVAQKSLQKALGK